MLDVLNMQSTAHSQFGSNTVFRIVKTNHELTLGYRINGSDLSIHFDSEDATSSGILSGGGQTDKFIIPAGVAEIYLKQLDLETPLTGSVLTGTEITEIDWSQDITIKGIRFNNATKLTKVSEYAPKGITDLYRTFYNCPAFNFDISQWNTSEVTNMEGMFHNATSFNQNLSGWNVDKVTNRTNFDTGATSWQANFKPVFPS